MSEDNTSLTEVEAARFLVVPVADLQRWRTEGGGPEWFTMVDRPLYLRRVLRAWLAEGVKGAPPARR